MGLTLNPFPALRAFIVLEVQALRTALRNAVLGVGNDLRADLHGAEDRLKAAMVAEVQAMEQRLAARLGLAPAAQPLPDSPVEERRVPRSTWEPGARGDAVPASADPLGGRPHP